MKGLMDELSIEGRNLKRLRDHIGKLEAMLDHPVRNVDGIEGLLDAIDVDLSTTRLDDVTKRSMSAEVEAIRSRSEGWRAERRKAFYPSLARSLSEAGLELKGSDPRLTVSCLTLERDDRDRIVIWYGPRHYRIARCDMDADAVYRAIDDAIASLGRNGIPPEELFDLMLSSYVDSIKLIDGGMGDPVPIAEIHRSLVVRRQGRRFWERCEAKELAPYPRMQFSHDLGSMTDRRRDGIVLTLRTATRSQTNHLDEFMWVPRSFDRLEGDHCSAVSFRRDA